MRSLNRSRVLWLFCRVIDHFGDAGVCWRLARQLHLEHGFEVTLFIDSPLTLAAIAPGIDWQGPAALASIGPGLRVRAWEPEHEAGMVAGAHPDPQVLVSGFGCDLPPSVRALAGRHPVAPLWINLQYLSAEPWVEQFHGKPSPKPDDGAVEHFFFPGFTPATGGLLREKGLEDERLSWLNDPARQAAFLSTIGATTDGLEPIRRVSLFCYAEAPLASWLGELQASHGLTQVLVANVCADAAFEAVGTAPRSQRFEAGGLVLVRVPPLSQDAYDRLLWSCDLNLVRGEDSWIRAHWARRPFIWQPYPQTERTHLAKLDAFLDQMADTVAPTSRQALDRAAGMMRAWSGAVSGEALVAAWRRYTAAIDALASVHDGWADQLAKQPDLALRLVEFMDARL